MTDGNLPVDENGKSIEEITICVEAGADFITTVVPVLDKNGNPMTFQAVFSEGHLRGITTVPAAIRVGGQQIPLDTPVTEVPTTKEKPVEAIPTGGRQG